MSDAFEAGRFAANFVIGEFMQDDNGAEPWRADQTFIFIMGLRAQRDGWGAKDDAREYLRGALAASAVIEENSRFQRPSRMEPEPRYDVYTDAGAVRLDYLWPIAENQSPIQAFKWRTLLVTHLWTVELRSVGRDMETWAKEQVIAEAMTDVDVNHEDEIGEEE